MIGVGPSSRWRAMRGFVGSRALAAGAVLVVTSLAMFAIDLALAVSLQRFLSAADLVTRGERPPFGIPLGSSLQEGLALGTIGVVRALLVWLTGMLTGICHVAIEVDRRQAVTRWSLASGNAALGRVMTLYNDLAVGSAAAITNVFYLAGRGLLAIATLAALLWYSLEMTLVVLATIALVAPLQARLDSWVKASATTIQSSLAAAMDQTSVAVKNALFLRIHGIVGDDVRRIGESMAAYAFHSHRFYSLSAVRSVLPQLLGLLVVIAVAIKGGGWLGDDKTLIVAYLFLVLRLFQNLADFARVTGNLLLNWPRLRATWKWWRNEFEPSRNTIEHELTETDSGPPLAHPIGWRAAGVGFAWEPSAPTAIERLDLDIAPGSILVVTGPSGSGKTSLLLLLAGLVEPTAGRIILTGNDLDGVTAAAARQRLLRSIAYVGPDPFTIPGTIRDQLVLGLPDPPDDATLQAALAQAHCDFVFKLKRGLEHRVSEQGGGLSAGQKQRLALARALMRQPAALFLDEATSNLDAETESAVIDTIARLRGRMTIVAITHRESMLRIADRVLRFAPEPPPQTVGADHPAADLAAGR